MSETDEQAMFQGRDAKRLMDDPILQGAFKAVEDSLENAALACERTDAEQARAICISKQLLAGLKREIYRYVQTGKIAEEMIERKRKSLLPRMFQR